MKTALSILFLFILLVAYPQGKPLESFVPAGWKVIATAKGDLNKDGTEDMALVIENTDSKNFILNNEGMGHDTLNTNPRHLLILCKQGNGYSTKEINKVFIPSQHQAGDYCLDDPFLNGQNDFFIKNGVLTVSFTQEAVCGQYEGINTQYKFREEKNELVLIGYDEWFTDKIKGGTKTMSINFITRRKIVTTGGNMIEEHLNHPVTIASTTKLPNLIKLAALKSESENNLGF